MTALQESDAADLQARVTGLLESIASATTGIGFLLGGIITTIASPPVAFAVSGIGVVVLVAIGAAFRAIPRRAATAGTSARPRRRPAAPSGGA